MVPRTDIDLIVVGSGVAGLTAALAGAERGASVLLVTAGALSTGSSWWAQGGVAAAVGSDDRPAYHAADTMAVGAGLNDRRAVNVLVNEGRRAVTDLLRDGVPFDGGPEHPDLTLEAGHHHRRILHANGGATGEALSNALLEDVLANPTITALAETPVDSLIREEGRVVGIIANGGRYYARGVVLATGGYAGLWSRSTNPPGNNGSGLCMAWQVGATLADLEFVQFHPTALSLPNAPSFLLSEALRGEGARLVDGDEHPVIDPLLPRDVVARAIARHLRDHGQVYLSLRHLDPDFVHARFPALAAPLRNWGLDLARDLLPVAPAAHYCMGGIRTDTSGRSDVPGLYAAGEVACTGVQGANRLASNSLLECLVFGRRAAEAALSDGFGEGNGQRATGNGQRDWRDAERGTSSPAPGSRLPTPVWRTSPVFDGGRTAEGLEGLGLDEQPFGGVDGRWVLSADPCILRPGQCVLDDYLGVERTADGLLELLERLPAPVACGPESGYLVAGIAARAALMRSESRGAHYRADAPDTEPAWQGRILWRRDVPPRFEEVLS